MRIWEPDGTFETWKHIEDKWYFYIGNFTGQWEEIIDTEQIKMLEIGALYGRHFLQWEISQLHYGHKPVVSG